MANALAPQNPLAEVAELFGKDGLAHKDLDNLTVAIDSLISTLEKRAGKEKDGYIFGRGGKNPRDPYSDEKTPRSLKNDVIGFVRGLVDSFASDPKEYFKGKSSLPDELDKKIDPTLNDAALTDMKIPVVEEQPQDITQPTTVEPVSAEQPQDTTQPTTVEPVSAEQPQPTTIEPVSTEQPQPTTIEPVSTEQPQDITQPITTNETSDDPNTNKVLSDMVEVLIDLRDDKTQHQILQEAIEIRKIIFDQSNKIELPGGVEPNSDSAKQEDREKLAEAIATRLKDVMGDMGSNSPFGIDFDFDKNKKGKPGGAGKPSKLARAGNMLKGGAGLAMLGRGIAGAAVDYGLGEFGVGKDEEGEDLQIDEKQDDENWNKMTIGEKMQSGLARGIEKAGSVTFLDNIAREAQADRIKNETKYLKDKKVAAPVGETDDQARLRIDRENEDREEARIEAKLRGGKEFPNKMRDEKKTLGMKRADGATLTNIGGADGMPDVWQKVEPKPTVNSVSKLLETKTDENTDLKADISESKTRTMIAPVVSNKTNNYTEQTIIGTPPSPHPSTNSFLRFQNKISGYTDSVR